MRAARASLVWNTSANRTVKAKFHIGNHYGEWIGEQEAEVWPTKLTGTGVGKNVYVVRRDDVRANHPTAVSNCKAKGYRLPNRAELKAIYENRANYGTFIDRSEISSRYLTSVTEYDGVYVFVFYTGQESAYPLMMSNNVRCVKDIP